jgi:hypothetical protein
MIKFQLKSAMNLYKRKTNDLQIKKNQLLHSLPDLHVEFKCTDCLLNTPLEYVHEAFNTGSYGC